MKAMKNNTSLIKPSPKKLNGGQEALFILICNKLKNNDQMEYSDIAKIYSTKVQIANFTWDYRYDAELSIHDPKREKIWYKRRWSPEYTAQVCQSWFLRSLGSLITKGYVNILPKIDLLPKGLL